MIDGFESLSCVLWTVAAMAAGMYPLGLMLGGSCSPCCGICDDVFEFDRCVRFESTAKLPLRTHFAAQEQPDEPLHGYSRAVTRPEDVGARRVGTKATFAASIRLEETEPPSLSSMSDGETQSATFRYYFRKSALPGFELGTIKRWNVTLVGVTRPLAVPESVSELEYLVGPFAVNPYPIREYGVGALSDSTSAPVSVSVHSVAIRTGVQFIDGETVTDATLKSMLTATIPLRNGVNWVTRLEFAATAAPFQYVPVNSFVTLEYVIKHSRGSQHRFASFKVRVYKTGGATVVPLPADGLTPPSLPQPPYENTSYEPTSLKYSETDPDAVTLYSSDSAGVKSLKTVAITLTGEQLRYPTIYLDAGNSASVKGNSHESTFTEHGWIMRPYDPGATFGFDSSGHPSENAWIYDTEKVWSFLNGGESVSYYPASGSVFEMRVEGPTQFCGKSFCEVFGAGGSTGKSILYGDAIEKVVTMTVGKQPQKKISTNYLGVAKEYDNACYGQDNIGPVPLFLQRDCKYEGSFGSCQGFEHDPPLFTGPFNPKISGIGLFQGSTGGYGSVSARAFYCGDLLWVIENGPCRQFITKDRPGYVGNDTLTLGGSTAPYPYSTAYCPNGGVRDGFTEQCYPPEIDVEIKNITRAGGPRSAEGCFPCDAFSPGTADPEIGYSPAVNQVEGTYVLTGGMQTCLKLFYGATTVTAGTKAEISFVWSKNRWCKPFEFQPEREPPPDIFFARDWAGFLVEMRFSNQSTFKRADFSSRTFNHFDAVLVPADPGKGIPKDYYACGAFCPQMNWRNKLQGSIAPSWSSFFGSDLWVGAIADFSYSGLNELVPPVAHSIQPATATIPAEGGSVSLNFCCPEKTVTVSAAAADNSPNGGFSEGSLRFGRHKFDQTLVVTDPSYPGVVGYVTQTGYNATKCPFNVIWLAGVGGGVTSFALGGGIDGRIFSPGNCPIEAQISHAEQPGCEWSVSSAEHWLIAEKTDEGLLRLSIDWSQPATYSGSLPGYFKPYRSSVITISSGGTDQQWLIIEIKS